MLVSISELKGHELPKESRVDELEQLIRRRRAFVKPIVVDRNTMVILDGHCRCGALRRLGFSKVAVKFVDYSSNNITVESWNRKKVTKREVIEAGLSGSLMLPKSSKHMVRMDFGKTHISEICGEIFIPLEELV
jgi:ParB-like chromosome segregation protein Spo0J